MKRFFTTVCIAAMTCSFASAQTADPTLARVDVTVDGSKNTNLAKEKSVRHVNAAENTNAERTSTASTFKMPSQRSTLNSKVGPNGEELFQKKNRYFYYNDAGKKIKVRQSELKDKPKSS